MMLLGGQPWLAPECTLVASALFGATLNTSGALVVRSERVDAQTMLAQIVQLVVQPQRSRVPMQSIGDRVAGWFVLVVVVIALATFVAWGLLLVD